MANTTPSKNNEHLWSCVGAVLAAIIGGYALLVSVDKLSLPGFLLTPTPTLTSTLTAVPTETPIPTRTLRPTTTHTPAPTSTTIPRSAFPNIEAEIKNVWFDHGVTQEGVRGMIVHFSFVVTDGKNAPLRLSMYFYDEEGVGLVDKNGKYDTTGGYVAAGKSVVPPYAISEFEDFTIFFPYEEFHITETGEHFINYTIRLYFPKENEQIAEYKPTNRLKYTVH